MKNIFTLALAIIAIGLILQSCSQPINTSRIESQNTPATNEVKGTNTGSENEGNYPYAIVGISPEIVRNVEVKDTPNTITESYEKSLLAESIIKSKKVQSRNAPMNNSFSRDRDKVSQDMNVVSFDHLSNQQMVNYSGNAGHSGGGRLPLWFMVVLAIFIPPLAVAIMYGITDKFWICLGLTCIFFIPGMIYALIQVFH